MTLSATYEILRVETEVVGGANAPRHAGEQATVRPERLALGLSAIVLLAACGAGAFTSHSHPAHPRIPAAIPPSLLPRARTLHRPSGSATPSLLDIHPRPNPHPVSPRPLPSNPV
jgi:hypothetical protein